MDIFSGEQFTDQTFRRLKLQGSEVTLKEFFGCQFVECDFTEVTFRRCRFVQCVFSGCNLTLVHVPGCGFRETTFRKSKAVGINWTEATWGPKLGILNSIAFEDSEINHSTFISLELPGLRVVNCIAHDVDFAEADLSRADFSGTDLADSRFWHTNLTEANLNGATAYSVNATVNTLHKTKFALPEAITLLLSLDIELSEADHLLLRTRFDQD